MIWGGSLHPLPTPLPHGLGPATPLRSPRPPERSPGGGKSHRNGGCSKTPHLQMSCLCELDCGLALDLHVIAAAWQCRVARPAFQPEGASRCAVAAEYGNCPLAAEAPAEMIRHADALVTNSRRGARPCFLALVQGSPGQTGPWPGKEPRSPTAGPMGEPLTTPSGLWPRSARGRPGPATRGSDRGVICLGRCALRSASFRGRHGR
jgi:hypothetical protein